MPARREKPQSVAVVARAVMARSMAGSVRFRALQASIRELKGAIKSNDRATAQAKLEECRALDWTGLESLLEMYRARLK